MSLRATGDPGTFDAMLRLLIDTSTWLDICKRRNGQRWIVALRVLHHQGKIELLVPALVIDEFERNRARIEASMTASVAERFRLIRQDLDDYGWQGRQEDRRLIEDLARHVPLIGAMTTRNFVETLELLRKGRNLEPTSRDRGAVVDRGLLKKAPFHRSRNSVADALLIELYASVVDGIDLKANPHAFITSNSDDFSLRNGDKRQPHEDIAELFESRGSSFGLGIDGLNAVLIEYFGDEVEELFIDVDIPEEPRRLDEIMAAHQELWDRIWYERSLMFEMRHRDAGKDEELQQMLSTAGPGRKRVEETYTRPGDLGPYTNFEWGMLNGKLSALNWVLGEEWDFLDT